MSESRRVRTRAATFLLLLTWVLLALAMAEPVADWVLRRGYRGLPFLPQGLHEAIRPCLLGAGGTSLLAALVILFRVPMGADHHLVDWHTRALRVGGLLYLFGGILCLMPALFSNRAGCGLDFLPWDVLADVQFLGAYLGLATGALLFAAFLARRRGWATAAALTSAANLVLGFGIPSGTFLMVVWLMRIRPEEEPPPSG